MKKLLTATVAFLTLSICGCGGGGGGTAVTGTTTAVVKVSTGGTVTPLSGVGVTVNLPVGVSVSTDAGGNVNPGVATASGVALGHASVAATYAPATRQVTLTVTSTDVGGFSSNAEFVTLNCVVAAGNSPLPTDFSLSNFTPSDLSLATAAGVTSSFAATIQ